MTDSEGWKLIKQDTRQTVLPGVELLDFRGEEWRIDAIGRLPEGNSTGRVRCSRPWPGERPTWAADRERDVQEVYPSVFGLEIVKDVPQAEQALFEQLSEEMGDSIGDSFRAMTMEAIGRAAAASEHSAACVIHRGVMQALAESVSTAVSFAIHAAMEWGRQHPDEETHDCE